jgi:putative endonuclease
MFYSYVLLSDRDGKFYTGFTRNLKLRMKEHERGLVESTRDRRPLKLVYYEACLDEHDAIKREKYFKSGFGRRYLRNRLESYMKRMS